MNAPSSFRKKKVLYLLLLRHSPAFRERIFLIDHPTRLRFLPLLAAVVLRPQTTVRVFLLQQQSFAQLQRNLFFYCKDCLCRTDHDLQQII